MPITRSAKKALRQTKRRALRNLKRKSDYRAALKRSERLLAAKKPSEAAALLPQTFKALDKAVKTGVLHRNAASRRKARLIRQIRSANAASV